MPTKQPPTKERFFLDELDQALETFELTTGLPAHVVKLKPDMGKEHRPDAVVEIYVAGKPLRYAVEAKARVDRLTTLGHIKAQLDHMGKRGLLFAPYITPTIAKRCRELNIAFLDLAGNAYLQEPGLHVYITGEKPDKLTTIGKREGGTATALRVMFVLLCKPELLNAPYRDIVAAANVALGAIGWVFFDLEKRGYIAGKRETRHRRFLEAIHLFEEWVTNYPIKLRPKLNPRRFRAGNPEWWKRADFAGLQAYWGGEVAAHRLTNYLKPATYTLYIAPKENDTQPTPGLARLVAANRLRADALGDIEILDAFWHLPPDPNHPDVVPPILAYADLVATLDPRNIEAAKLLRNQYIDDALRKV